MSALTERCMLTTDTLVAVATSLNSMGPTPTRTLGMRLSCNFVNVYTIVYHVQYTYTRVHARIPNGHPRKQKLECRTKVRGQVGELNGPRAPRPACRGAARADFRARILARKSVRKSMSVSVSVPWNLSY